MNKLTNILASITKQRLVLPFYHSVTDNNPAHIKHLYAVRSKKQFVSDLSFFAKNYKALSISDLNSSNKKQKSVCITFDDGLREFKEIAWPLLQKYDFPVALFINPSFVDNKAMFFRFKSSLLIDAVNQSKLIDYVSINQVSESDFKNASQLNNFILNVGYKNQLVLDSLAIILGVDFASYLEKNKPYLTLDELKELQSQGVIIGAHSMDHPLFNKLTFDEQITQITQSVDWVAQHLSGTTKAFSFPFTDFGLSAQLFKHMFNPKFSLVDLSFGTAGIKREHFANHYQRIPMEEQSRSAKTIIMQQYLYYLLKAPFCKNTIRR